METWAMFVTKTSTIEQGLPRFSVQRDATPPTAFGVHALQVEQIRLEVYPAPLKPQHLITATARVERQPDEVKQLGSPWVLLRPHDQLTGLLHRETSHPPFRLSESGTLGIIGNLPIPFPPGIVDRCRQQSHLPVRRTFNLAPYRVSAAPNKRPSRPRIRWEDSAAARCASCARSSPKRQMISSRGKV